MKQTSTVVNSGVFAALILLLNIGFPAHASSQETSDWPQLRGPGARGVATGKNLPEKWSSEDNVQWVAEVEGRGWSSPIVQGERVFVTSAVSAGDEKNPKKGLYLGGDQSDPSSHEHRWVVWCFDFSTGKPRWKRDVHQGKPDMPRHIKNNYAPETQVTDGSMIYSYFGDVGLFAHDMEGDPKWKHSWGAFKTSNNWGSAASPVLHGDKVIVVNDNDEGSFIEALDKTTGKSSWRLDRVEHTNWSTPYVWKHAARTEIITLGSQRTRSYSLDGKLLWELYAPTSGITISTPYSAHGLLYISSGFVGSDTRPIYAIRPGASGKFKVEDGKDLPKSIAWVNPKAAPYNTSTLVYGDLLYVLYDFGFFACYDAKTGEKVYGKQRVREEGNTHFTASPWAYNDRIYCLSEDGDCYVFRAGRKFELLYVNSIPEMCMATPAIARGSLFLRSSSKLYRIANTKKP
jgi:outer membrane protein assembly factor BamB